MKLKDILRAAKLKLTAPLFMDYKKIIAFVLKIELIDIYKLYDEVIDKKDFIVIEKHFEKRKTSYPLEYITNESYFYNRKFFVDERVLIPRKETEQIIDLVKNTKFNKMLDLCAGSGIIGITSYLETKKEIVLSDISQDALDIIKINAKRLNAEVSLVKSDLFTNIDDKFDLIVSNPPYIKTKELKSLDVSKHEPNIALDGGIDGLKFYKEILNNIDKVAKDKHVVIFEIGYNQAKLISDIALDLAYKVDVYKDYSGFDRVIKLAK